MWYRAKRPNKGTRVAEKPNHEAGSLTRMRSRTSLAKALDGKSGNLDGLVEDKIASGAATTAAEVPAALGAWRMGLVVTASALCGGIAVVLWNRRLLTKMREVAPVDRSKRQGRLWEDDV